MLHVSGVFEIAFENRLASKIIALSTKGIDRLLCCALRHWCCTTGKNWLTEHNRRMRRSFNPWLSQRRAFQGAFFAEKKANLILEKKAFLFEVLNRKKKEGPTDHAFAVHRAAWSTWMPDGKSAGEVPSGAAFRLIKNASPSKSAHR